MNERLTPAVVKATCPGSSPANRLDPRACWVVTFAFVVAVTSFGKYEVSRLSPFFLYPVAMAAYYRISLRGLLARVIWAMPFVLLVGLFNPFFDRHVFLDIAGFKLSGGWVSFISITTRSFLAVTSAALLVLIMPFERLCMGLEKLWVPRVLVTQLQMLHRYLSLLRGEALRMVRAHDLRISGRKPKIRLATAGSMIGLLLLRALSRAERVHRAMLVRGFDGEVRMIQPLRFRLSRDGLFILSWFSFFIVARFVNLPQWLSGWVVGK
jgi:cobalt/nickel transport system permease protein